MANYTINLDTGGNRTSDAISRILSEAPGLYSDYLSNKRAEAANVRANQMQDMQMQQYQLAIDDRNKVKESQRILTKYAEGSFNIEDLQAIEPADAVGKAQYRKNQKAFYEAKPKDPYTVYLQYAEEMRNAGLNPNPQSFYSLYTPLLKQFQSQKTGKFNELYRQIAEETKADANQMSGIMKDSYGAESMLQSNQMLFAGDPNPPGLQYVGHVPEDSRTIMQKLGDVIYKDPVEYGGQEYGGGWRFPGGSTGRTAAGGAGLGFAGWHTWGEYADTRDAFKTQVTDDMKLHHSTFKKKYGFTQKSVSSLTDDEIWKKAKKSTKTSFMANTKFGKNVSLLKGGALPYGAMVAGGMIQDALPTWMGGGDPILDRLPGGKEGKASRVTQEVSDMAKVPATAATVGIFTKAKNKVQEKGITWVAKEIMEKKGATWFAQRLGKAGLAGLATYFSSGFGSALAYGFIAKDMYDIAVILAED